MNLTVKEYANLYNVSKQAIYNRIKRGTLSTVKVNGTTYIIDNTRTHKNHTNKDLQCNKLKKIENRQVENDDLINKINDLNVENKLLNKDVEYLKKQVEELKKDKEKMEEEKENLLKLNAISQNNIKELTSTIQQLEYRAEGKQKRKWWNFKKR